MNELWNNFQSFVKISIPTIIIEILIASGYNDPFLLSGMTEKEIKSIEIFVSDNSHTLCERYSNLKPFVFLPGHKKLLMGLAKKAEEYELKHKPSMKKIDDWNQSNTPVLMKKLIKSMHENSNTPRHRYSDTIMDFALYIYMVAGKSAYEVLCANLPLPQVSTVCKFILKRTLYKVILKILSLFTILIYLVTRIHEGKSKIIEGELRCKELSEYLDKHNAPREVWISEDASGIVAKVMYDSTTNQIVGLVLPTNKNTGMPETFSFTPQSAIDIDQQIKENPQSTLVYLVMAQPLMDNVPPFILQIFGSDNRFTSKNVLLRWKHTKDQLSR